jgi:chromosome segregation ATPase
MSEQQRIYTEGGPWFWKIFGGAIVSLVSILLLSYITNINSNSDRSISDVRGDIKELRNHLDAQKERLSALEQLACKEKIASLEKTFATLQTSLEEQKQKTATCEANNTSLKEEVKILRETNKELTKQVQEIREKMAAEKGKKPEQP